MITASVIFCVVEPLLAADTVTECIPTLALRAAVILSTLLPDPGADKVAGVKVAETPLGNPVMEKETAALKPPLTATLSVALLFDAAGTITEFAEAVT